MQSAQRARQVPQRRLRMATVSRQGRQQRRIWHAVVQSSSRPWFACLRLLSCDPYAFALSLISLNFFPCRECLSIAGTPAFSVFFNRWVCRRFSPLRGESSIPLQPFGFKFADRREIRRPSRQLAHERGLHRLNEGRVDALFRRGFFREHGNRLD